jgi:hypothetical protein
MFNDKVLKCKDCGRDFEFTVTEQEFFAKKGSRTNLDVVLSAVQPEKHKTKAAVAMAVKNAKCSQLFALLAEKIRLFLSNRLVKSLFIAESVLYPNHVTTGKSLTVETFVGLRTWEGFLFMLGKKV